MPRDLVHLLGDLVDDCRGTFAAKGPPIIVYEKLLLLALYLPQVHLVELSVVLGLSFALFTHAARLRQNIAFLLSCCGALILL